MPRSSARLTAARRSAADPRTMSPAVGPQPKPISGTSRPVRPKRRRFIAARRLCFFFLSRIQLLDLAEQVEDHVAVGTEPVGIVVDIGPAAFRDFVIILAISDRRAQDRAAH